MLFNRGDRFVLCDRLLENEVPRERAKGQSVGGEEFHVEENR